MLPPHGAWVIEAIIACVFQKTSSNYNYKSLVPSVASTVKKKTSYMEMEETCC